MAYFWGSAVWGWNWGGLSGKPGDPAQIRWVGHGRRGKRGGVAWELMGRLGEAKRKREGAMAEGGEEARRGETRDLGTEVLRGEGAVRLGSGVGAWRAWRRGKGKQGMWWGLDNLDVLRSKFI